MTSSGCNIHQFGLYVDGNHAEGLDHVDYQQRIMSASGTSDPLEVSAKA